MNNYTLEQIKIGTTESFVANISEEIMLKFREITGDINPLHCNEDYALSKGHSGRVAYGMLTASFLSTLAGVYLPGERSLIQSVETKFLKPVYVGDVLTIKGTVTEKYENVNMILIKVIMVNQNNIKVVKSTMQVIIK